MSLSRRFSKEISLSQIKEEEKKIEKEKKRAVELDKKLLGPGGLEMLQSMTSKEIDRKFKQLLGTMGVKDGKLKDKYSTEEKKLLIEAVIQQHQEQLETPETYVASIREYANIHITVLDKLLEKLHDSEWVSLFIAAEGCTALIEAILFCLFKASSLTGSDPEDIPRLEKLLDCVSQMVNTGLGLEEILELPNSLKNIALSLEYVTVEKKTAIFEFLAAACLILEDGSLIVEALDFYRLFQPESFELFLEELRDNIDLKVAYFMLINTLIVNTNEAKERRKIRANYMKPDVFALYKEDDFDEDVKEQLSIYQEELQNDKESETAEELGQKINIVLEDLEEAERKEFKNLINSVLHTVKLKPASIHLLLSILHKIDKEKGSDVHKSTLLAAVIKDELDHDKHGELAKALGSSISGELRNSSSEKKDKKKTSVDKKSTRHSIREEDKKEKKSSSSSKREEKKN